jgi:hypothetical protein
VGGNLHFGAKIHQEMHSRVSFDLEISVPFGPHSQHHCPPPPPCFYRWWCHRSSSLPPSEKNQDPNLNRAAATTARTKPSSDETMTPPPLSHTARTATALRRRHRISTVLRLTTARSPCTGLVTSDEVVERGRVIRSRPIATYTDLWRHILFGPESGQVLTWANLSSFCRRQKTSEHA